MSAKQNTMDNVTLGKVLDLEVYYRCSHIHIALSPELRECSVKRSHVRCFF